MEKTKNPNPNYIPPASVHVPERRIPAQKPISETITISVAEYHWLTKAAAMLEVVLADKSYNHENVVAAVRNAMADMVEIAMRPAEAGAEE